MEWTDTFPEKEGFYWFRNEWRGTEVVEVERDVDEKWIAWTIGSELRDFVDDLEGQWYGPIEPPEEA